MENGEAKTTAGMTQIRRSILFNILNDFDQFQFTRSVFILPAIILSGKNIEMKTNYRLPKK